MYSKIQESPKETDKQEIQKARTREPHHTMHESFTEFAAIKCGDVNLDHILGLGRQIYVQVYWWKLAMISRAWETLEQQILGQIFLPSFPACELPSSPLEENPGLHRPLIYAKQFMALYSKI